MIFTFKHALILCLGVTCGVIAMMVLAFLTMWEIPDNPSVYYGLARYIAGCWILIFSGTGMYRSFIWLTDSNQKRRGGE